MSFDVIVVGEGIAGLAAARDCARAGLRTGTVEQLMFGGLVTSINELVDWPAEGGEPCSGSDLAASWITEAADAGVESLGGCATGLASAPGGLLLLHTGERLFTQLVPFLILFASGLLAVQEPVRRWVQHRSERRGRPPSELWAVPPVFLAAIYGGFFGGGRFSGDFFRSHRFSGGFSRSLFSGSSFGSSFFDDGRGFLGHRLLDHRRRIGGGLSGGGGAIGFLLRLFLGALVGLAARLALGRVVARGPLHDADLAELTRHAVGGLGTLADPFLDAFQLQGDAVRVILLQQGIIGAYLFDETAIAGRVAVSDDDRIIGALLGAATGETDLEHGSPCKL
jgi:hypothetical protein